MREIKLVESKHAKGCGIACLAMILGKDYDEIERQFEGNFDKRGTEWETKKNFLGDHGFSIIEKKCSHWEHKDLLRSEMLRPFAPIHLVSLRPYVDSRNGHAVVMDGKGKIFDPAGFSDKHIRNNVYLVDCVLGLYPIKK